jgi:4-nitrophenol 2-monooxygenase / 4-nitrocatechol 4-monooxygenase, reductase component
MLAESASVAQVPSVAQSVPVDWFKHVVGHITAGVAIVTCADDGVMYGMTASSVTSLSAEPPMMLACLNASSSTCPAVGRAGGYVVNVLGYNHQRLARQFAAHSADKFRDVATVADPDLGHPVIRDALANITCEVVDRMAGGSHIVYFGRVIRATVHDGQPLAYYRGKFGRFDL